MPAAGLIFDSGPARVAFDRSGRVTSAVHRELPDLGFLTGASLGPLTVDGELLEPGEPEVLADVDELELVHVVPGRLRVVVRHTFAAGWGLRVAVSSLAGPDEPPQQVERALLRLQPGPGCVAWALALGVTAAYTLLPAGGTGPVLGGVLRRGSVTRATPDGLELSPFELRSGARYVLQLQWDWYRTPRAFGPERTPEAPSALVVQTGEPVSVRVDEDVAVVAPPEVETDQTADHLEVVSQHSGSYAFELRSARGTTAFDLRWVAPVQEALSRLVPAALSRPRSPAGVVRLSGVAEALVVQHALAANEVDDPDLAAEALDLHTARLSGAGQLLPLEVAYLCREYDRLGDPDLLDVASTAVLGRSTPEPGLGIAATQLCLALMVSGRGVQDVLAFLGALADATEASRPMDTGRGAPERGVPELAGELELIAVTHAGPGISGAPSRPLDLTRRIAALGVQLGAGLRGQPVRPLPVADLAHLIAVFQLLPDGLSAGLRELWGCSVHELARRATPELLARLEGRPVDDAHAWLVLALQG